mmetsp:Transcript_24017/g.69012  ORF Transcript_24017/g.69012 Transcript_24017/m.69012 type:complete len:722 (-) Transcript_24017:1240-3405(-)
MGLATSISTSAILGSVLLLLGSFDLKDLEHHLMVGLPNIIRDLIDQLLQLGLLGRSKGTALHWRCRRVVSLVAKDVVPRQEDIVRVPSGITGTTNADSLKDTTASELLNNVLRLKVVGNELIVGLQATNVVRDRGIDAGAKGLELGGKLSTDGLGCHGSSATSLLRSDVVANIMDKPELGRLEKFSRRSGELVLVLLQPTIGGVLDRAGIVLNGELVLHPLLGRCRETIMLVAAGIQVPRKLLIGRLGNDALLVKQGKDARMLHIDQIQNVLVVREGNELPQNALLFVFLLLHLEHELVELLLERLIGVVDAQLLKVVDLEGFEAEDIQHADRGTRPALVAMEVVDGIIHSLHDVVERGTIDRLDEGLGGLDGLLDRQGLVNDLDAGIDDARGQGIGQLLERHTQQGGGGQRGVVLVQDAGFVVMVVGHVGGEGHVAGVEDGHDEAHEGLDHLGIEPDGDHGVEHLVVIVLVADAIPSVVRARLAEEAEVGVLHPSAEEGVALLGGCRRQELVEDVVVALPGRGMDEADLLQKVRLDGGTAELAVGGEADVDVLAEPRRVVVADGPGVAERLEDGVALQHLLLDGNVAGVGVGSSRTCGPGPAGGQVAVAGTDGAGLGVGNLLGQHGEVVEDDLGRDRLAGSGFARHQDGLVGGSVGRRTAGGEHAGGAAASGTGAAPAHEAGVLDAPHHGPVGIVGRLVRVGGEALLVRAGRRLVGIGGR